MLKRYLGIFKRDKSNLSKEELKWQLKCSEHMMYGSLIFCGIVMVFIIPGSMMILSGVENVTLNIFTLILSSLGFIMLAVSYLINESITKKIEKKEKEEKIKEAEKIS